MVFDDYEPAVRLMRQSLLIGPTDSQAHLARVLGVEIIPSEPRSVIAAKLRDRVLPLTDGRDGEDPPAITDRQRELLQDLDRQPGEISKTVAFAWIGYYFTIRNIDALLAIKPKRGDWLTPTPAASTKYFWKDEYLVLSIRSDGFLYFKGNDHGWPHQFVRHFPGK